MGTEEEEEEEYLVHVEFDSILDIETFKKPNLFFKVIGIDSEKPIMQIGDQVFTGQYCDIPGTALFFEEEDNEAEVDAVFAKTAEKTLCYKYKTRKSLIMRRVFIKKKDSSSANGSVIQDEAMNEDDDMDFSEHGTFSQHIAESDSFLGTELGMEMTGAKLVEETCVSVNDPCSSSSKKSKMSEDPKHKTEIRNIEPIAGPSWAPDVSTVDCDNIFEELPTSTVNAEEMSRLIVEQMTLESDIKMQNASSSQNVG